MNIHYITKKCKSLTNTEIEQCSILFSNHYGYYSNASPIRPKERIRLGKGYYESLAKEHNTFASLAYHGEDIVGQAFYVLERKDDGYTSWIIQLVVNENFRRQSIAKKLLLSVWGFSNDKAWGLATSNPLTIKTLESATFRKVSFIEMQKNIKVIQDIGQKISFIKDRPIEITDNNATVDSEFFVNHDSIKEKIAGYENKGVNQWIYHQLDEGKEWLAFVFQDQEINLTAHQLDNLLKDSESCLVDAYSRMQIKEQPWAKGTKKEVDFIANYFTDETKSIIDFGCGIGRHLFELERRGYANMHGIDFSERHIQYCQNKESTSISFEVADCRTYASRKKYDYALCLYDVIGSFPDQQDNIKILNTLYHTLTDKGIAIISVMNMELTKNIATNITNIYENPQSIVKLKSSNTMQETGNIFNPEYFIIDTASGNVFRKEKFTNDGGLSAEYIVRDRRYNQAEIEALAKQAGFDVIEIRFVRAGDWSESLSNIDLKAKEILLVLKKLVLKKDTTINKHPE